MKRPPQPEKRDKGKWTCPDAEFLKTFPTLAEGMCDVWWEDGKPRKVWRASVSMDGTMVRLTLSDEDLAQSSFTDAESLWEAFRLVEEALASGTLQWRKWKGGFGKK